MLMSSSPASFLIFIMSAAAADPRHAPVGGCLCCTCCLPQKVACPCRYKPLQQAFGGVIFDSSPCYMHLMVGARAVAEGLRGRAAAVAQAAFILGVFMLTLVKPLIGFWPSRFW